MADQTVRTIYQANVAQAQRSMTSLAKDTDKAADSVDKLDKGLDAAGKKNVKPKIDLDIQAAEKEVQKLTKELDELEKLDADVRVEADVEAARGDLAKAEAELSALQGAKAEMVVTVDGESVEADLDDMGDAAEDAGADAGDRAGAAIMDGLSGTPVVGAVTGLVAAAGIGIAAGLRIGAQAIAMEDFFGARTGMDEATARKYGAAAAAAYSDAWGTSIQDNLNTAEAARGNALIGDDSTGREIQKTIEQLTAVSEILGSDIPETAEAAGNMIRSGLAENAEDAFDVIVTGAQNGMNRSEDLLDTLREYSGMFESLGLSGAEALGLIDQMMEAGARNSDVAADALKEFSIRAQDDSAATREAYESIGLSADDMGAQIAAGGDQAKEGLDTVLDALREIEDPVQRNLAGVALFGTMWEDMGNGAGVLGADLDELSDAWVNVGDTTTDAMDRMADNAATKLESAKRDITTAATTLLGGLASTLEEPIGAVGDYVSENSAEVLGFLIDLGNGFFDLGRAAVEFGATTIEVLGDVAGAFAPIVRGIADTLVAFGVLTSNQDMIDLGNSIGHASNDMETFGETADGAADTLRTEVGGALDEAEAKFNDWTGPALMQAEINDALTAMTGDLDEFVAYVDELPGGVITINGDTTGGEEAMNSLMEEVAESNGTVDINGETVEAEDAVQHVKDLAAEGAEITVTANTDPAESSLDGIMTEGAPVQVPVDADTAGAQEDVEIWGSQVGDVPATVHVQADLYGTEATMEAFYAEMMERDWTIDINGETVDATEALDILLEEVNNGEGSVTINGMTFPADTSLMALIEAINMSDGTVTIDGDPTKANTATDSAKAHADGTTGEIDVDADTADAEGDINHTARGRGTYIDVDHNASSADSSINSAARDRNSRIYVRYSVVGGTPQVNFGTGRVASGMALGGRLDGYGGYGSGYGIVPGPRAPYGTDNVLWPTTINASGTLPGRATGGTLNQPLAGGEWVVNPVSSKQHDSLLSAINAGATQAQIAAMAGGGGGTASVDSGVIAAAMTSGMRGMTLALNMDGRTLYGAVVDAGKAQRQPFVTRRG